MEHFERIYGFGIFRTLFENNMFRRKANFSFFGFDYNPFVSYFFFVRVSVFHCRFSVFQLHTQKESLRPNFFSKWIFCLFIFIFTWLQPQIVRAEQKANCYGQMKLKWFTIVCRPNRDEENLKKKKNKFNILLETYGNIFVLFVGFWFQFEIENFKNL